MILVFMTLIAMLKDYKRKNLKVAYFQNLPLSFGTGALSTWKLPAGYL
jgi:hypothetical protein